MAIRKTVKSQNRTITIDVPANSGLARKLEKVSKQTGLSPHELLQKWILQEESMIGVIHRSQGQAPEQIEEGPDFPADEIPTAQGRNSKDLPHNSPEYRRMLFRKAKQLRKAGMTLKKIADTFNDENLVTVSGSGKWYSSSIVNLLNSKK